MNEAYGRRLARLGVYVLYAAFALLLLGAVLEFRAASNSDAVFRWSLACMFAGFALVLFTPGALDGVRPLWSPAAPGLERLRAALLVPTAPLLAAGLLMENALHVLAMALLGLRWLLERPPASFDDLRTAEPDARPAPERADASAR